MSALSASFSDLAVTVGPIASSLRSQLLRVTRRLATITSMFLTGESTGEGLAYLSESNDCVAHMFSSDQY